MLDFEIAEQGAEMKIVGIGSSGRNAINRMIEENLTGVEFIYIDTDIQALAHSKAKIRLQIGEKITSGWGTGGSFERGVKAVEQEKDKIMEILNGADIIFITTGLGGGTGTGAAYRIAEYARTVGALSVGVITKPFIFEGKQRRRLADEGIELLTKYADTVIIIPNDKLLSVASSNISIVEAFRLADSILLEGVRSIIQLITQPGLINLDFNDLRTVIKQSGRAMIGIGRGKGEDRVVTAVKQAIESPLLETPIYGAKRVLLNVTGGPDLSLAEVNKAGQLVYEVVHKDAEIIFGTVVANDWQDETMVTIIATGFEKQKTTSRTPAVPKKAKVKEVTSDNLDFNSNSIDVPAFLRKK